MPVSWSGVVVFPIGLPGFWASVYCGRLVVVTAGCLARLSCPGPRGAPGGRGQAPWPARTCCTRGRRGSGVKGRPAGRSPQRCAAPLSLEGRPRRLRRTPRARTRRPGVSGRVGGGVPERGRGLRHCQAHIRVSSSQVGCSQDGAPHLRRASGCSKHSRGSFLPRRASRYTTGLGRGARCAPGVGSAGHLRPHEAGQLPGEGHDSHPRWLAAPGHLLVCGVQSLLGGPRAGQGLRARAGLAGHPGRREATAQPPGKRRIGHPPTHGCTSAGVTTTARPATNTRSAI